MGTLMVGRAWSSQGCVGRSEGLPALQLLVCTWLCEPPQPLVMERANPPPSSPCALVFLLPVSTLSLLGPSGSGCPCHPVAPGLLWCHHAGAEAGHSSVHRPSQGPSPSQSPRGSSANRPIPCCHLARPASFCLHQSQPSNALV